MKRVCTWRISRRQTQARVGERQDRRGHPIPDSADPARCNWRKPSHIPFREGFVKNRYIGRTFIMPGQALRKKSVRQKLNAIGVEFKGKNVLLVDDSIVRGTTSREIVPDGARCRSAESVFRLRSAAVRFPNVYGIDMPSRTELIGHRTQRCGDMLRDRRGRSDLSGSGGSQGIRAQSQSEHYRLRCLLFSMGNTSPATSPPIPR